MLEALGGPGERSILSQKRTAGNGEEEKDESLGDGESQKDNDIVGEVQEKRENGETPGSHEEEYEEKRENSEEENMNQDKKGKWIFFFLYACLTFA